jgi:hypothetical protein
MIGCVSSQASLVVRWQDYLSEATSGDLEQAREILEGLSQTDEIGLIPRSEILARIHGPAPSQPRARPAIKELLDRIKTLDDMSTAFETLKTWHTEGGGPLGEIQLAITALTPLDRTYREFNAGLSTSLEGFLTEARMCPNYVMPLRA